MHIKWLFKNTEARVWLKVVNNLLNESPGAPENCS